MEILGQEIDRLVSLEIRLGGFVRDLVPRLSQAATERINRSPVLAGAEGLIQRLKPGDIVVISIGAVGPPLCPKGETDGPTGAAALARALDIGFGVTPLYVGEEWMFDPMIAASQAAGITVRADEREAMDRPGSAMIRAFPKDAQAARAAAAELIDHFHPAAMISLEKLSANKKGILMSALGHDIGKPHCRADILFAMARERGIFTIGIGDNGNEIGFGLIHDVVERIHPLGAKCPASEDSGIASATATDVLIVANVSNWGGYGLCAMLSALTKRPELLHDEEVERRMLEDCVRAGAFDGIYVRQELYADGLPMGVQLAIITLLHALVDNALKSWKRPGF